MGYWFAYKNRKGNFKNYACSECHKSAPQDTKGRSIITETCPTCGCKLSKVGILENTQVVYK